MKSIEKHILFEKGMNGCFNYRIPSLLTTAKGTLIAAIDARVDADGDNPNNIDKAIRRSSDCGKTWSEIEVIVDYPGQGRKEGAAAIDPAMLYDSDTDTIWMIYCHTPGGIGLWNSHPGVGFNENGNKLLYDPDRNEYELRFEEPDTGEASGGSIDTAAQAVYRSKGRVYRNGEETDYIVLENGELLQNGKSVGNLFLNKGPLLEARTSFLQAICSEDDGLSWSKPIDLNVQIKEEWMRFIGAGPGVGIQLKSGKHKGRLVFPIYYSNHTNASHPMLSCCLIYSDDHGKTWQRGKSPNDGRVFKGQSLDSKSLSLEEAQLTEAQVVELSNGALKLYMRNHATERKVVYAISEDGGESFGEVCFDEFLLNPICQFSVISVPCLGESRGEGEGQDRVEGNTLLFSGPLDQQARIKGKVLLSRDEGKSWTPIKDLTDGSFMYSCLSVLPDGSIGVFYEAYEENTKDIQNIFESFYLT